MTRNKCDSKLEAKFLKIFKNYPGLVQQHRFHHKIAWRFDFAYPDIKLAVEIQGYGVGHASYVSMHGDYTKHNIALSLGWIIVYFMSIDIKPERVNKTIEIFERIYDDRRLRSRTTPDIHKTSGNPTRDVHVHKKRGPSSPFIDFG